MDQTEYVHTRKGRCMAQILEDFEERIEPRIPQDVAQAFKALVRRKVAALAVDCIELMKLKPNEELNGHGQDLKDRIFPDGPPPRQEEKV